MNYDKLIGDCIADCGEDIEQYDILSLAELEIKLEELDKQSNQNVLDAALKVQAMSLPNKGE